MAAIGGLILVYLATIKILGEAIGHRPLLTMGVLLVVVGIQFVSLGLLSELITSQHEERVPDESRMEQLVGDILD
jgi:dolichol-phosphate mannosyltransferase